MTNKNLHQKKIGRGFFFLIGAVLFLGAFLRLYRISEFLTFLGDEGRDMLVVKRLIVDHKLTLLGPITSVGSIYMGPIYYYFMAPFLWLSHFDPVGPSYMVVLFSIATLFLIYKICTKFFHPEVGIVASFLYAISPLPIIYGKSSWNPNIVPFFSLLAIYCLMQIVICKSYRYFPVLGATLGILFQLHYVTFMFILITISILMLKKFVYPPKYYFYAFLGLVATYSPFLLFEIRHGFVNFQQAIRFMLQQKSESPMTIYSVGNVVMDVSVRLFWRLIVIENAELTKLFILAVFFVFIKYYWKRIKTIPERLAFQILILWLGVGIFSYGLYRGVIYDYYFGSLFVVPYLLTGIFLFSLWQLSKIGKSIAVIVFILLTFFSMKHSPLWNSPSNLMGNTKTIAQFVFDKTAGLPYNFALIAAKNSDHAYRYFLEIWESPPTVIENPSIDPERKSVTDQLLVVCEEKECKPLGHPLWEIAGFGRAEITDEWQVATVRVFRLIHYRQN